MGVNKEIPKVVLQAQERVVEVPVMQQVDLVVQVPRPEIEYVDKQVPKVTTEAREMVVEVPQVFYEERLQHVPQVQVAEVVKQVAAPQTREVVKQIPKIVETRVIEKVVQVPSTLIQETAVEVPKVMHHEVVTQKASANMQQRVIQTGYQYQRNAHREEVVSRELEAQVGGEYNAQITHVREFAVNSQDVEISRVITDELVSEEAAVVTTMNLPAETHQRDIIQGGTMQYAAAPLVYGAPPVATSQFAAPVTTIQAQQQQILAEPIAGAQPVTTMTYGAPVTTMQYGAPQSVMMQQGQQVMYGAGQQVTYGAPMTTVVQGQGQSLFDMIDRNHDGAITREEFNAVIR